MNYKKIFFLLASCLLLSMTYSDSFAAGGDLYQIKIYQLNSKEQETRVDHFLQNAFIPALHRAGIAAIGVFKPLANDTALIRKIYVLIPFPTADLLVQLPAILQKDQQYAKDGAGYLDVTYNDPAYARIESIVTQAFAGMPHYSKPNLSSPATERIYELRSYEGASEWIHANKVKMFNEGGEIDFFKRLGFNAVFYSEVISGPRMPNLMYMTSFENMASHDQALEEFCRLSLLEEFKATARITAQCVEDRYRVDASGGVFGIMTEDRGPMTG